MLVLKLGRALWIEKLAFAPSGSALAAPAGASGVLLWNELTNGQKAEELRLPIPYVHRVAYTPDGEYLLAGRNQLCVVRLATRAVTQYDIHSWEVGFVPTPDSAHVVVSEQHPMNGARYGLWALPHTDKPVWSVTDNTFSRSGLLLVDGERFAVMEWRANKGICVTLRSVTTGVTISETGAIPEYPENMVLSPDGAFVACQVRGTILVQPIGGPFHQKPDVRNDNRKHFTGIAYHPSGKYLAATSNDATVKLYDTTTWEVARAFTWDIGRMRSITFSPDGALAAAGSDRGKVVVWDVDL